MKKSFLIACALFAASLTAQAQRFALIDMEYIMQHIPAYESANQEIEQSSKQWQDEVEKLAEEAKSMYESYQKTASSLTDDQRTAKEKAIVNKETEIAELRRHYFGPGGELAKLQEELMRPLQDAVYNAVKEIATEKGYAVVTDRASASSIIFASPEIDISDEVLARLDYAN
ncbi:OmpH family outer membrane protein [Bacteroides sp. ET71]|uniref:OmpH family outer membrane protein n=1 Tax=Bacteroides sp. ET71 TaxID=2939421 RepID=UPI002013BF47|nr:OmpH family outer membrane protein [Bacteroides sp. ET71]MCL1617098.1 OmpH family outer membrane protein [Bacteroides sp. ET71]